MNVVSPLIPSFPPLRPTPSPQTQIAPQQSAKFITAFFGQFRTSLRNDSVVNYESIWTLFSKSVTRQDALCNALKLQPDVNITGEHNGVNERCQPIQHFSKFSEEGSGHGEHEP